MLLATFSLHEDSTPGPPFSSRDPSSRVRVWPGPPSWGAEERPPKILAKVASTKGSPWAPSRPPSAWESVSCLTSGASDAGEVPDVLLGIGLAPDASEDGDARHVFSGIGPAPEAGEE